MLYVELHAKTNFSFQEGASHPDELVQQAAALGYESLAVTDRNSLAGVVRAHGAAKQAGLKLIVGAEITPEDALPVVLWATDRAAYGRLSRLITEGRRRAEKGECRIVLDDLVRHAEGLLAGVCVAEELQRAGEPGPLLRQVEPYRVIFGDRCWLLAELHYGPDDARLAEQFLTLARRSRIPLVAAGGVHYHTPERAMLHDVLTAVRHNCTVDEARGHLFANAERHLQPLEALAARFHFAPDALRRAVEISRRCTFSLDELRYEYPEELAPPGQTPLEYLKRVTWAGAQKRYPQGVPERVVKLLTHEFELIEELHYEAYFLTVWDLVRFARSRGILCQGRGSAANSVVCYCLGVTSVDPDRLDVLFERFVSRERNEAPDIDVDFEHERREEVIQYVYEKYGRDRAGMTAEVITYRPRMAVRDVGKALGLPEPQIDTLAKSLEHFHADPDFGQRLREAGVDPASPVGRQVVELTGQLVGFPRHLSQHTGGMVMTRGPLSELVPIENATMPDRTVIEWNKDDLDELGILKVDCLALGMLTAIRKTFDLVRKHDGRELTLANVPESDPAVYEMIRRADTMGVFQIESRAQMSMLPRLRPRCFYDLVIEVAIVRPGPIQGEMVHPYLRRRAGLETVSYPNDEIRAVLEKTLGVPLFQEQAMRLAVVAAGFTPGEADQLRRAMAAWRRPGLIDEFRQKLIRGMTANGLSPAYAESVFRQIRGFGEYGFPESHSASFALLVYVSAWLKCHAMAAFTAGVLNSQPMGFYAPAQLVRNAREHGVEVRGPDVNRSDWDCTLEEEEKEKGLANGQSSFRPLALRLGLRMLGGLGEAQARRIEAARRPGGPFRSMEDFVRRTGLGRAVAVRLAKAGAMESLGLDRRGALWHALAQDQKPLPLLDQLETRPDERPENLPAMSAAEEVLADYRTAGLSLRAHPLSFLRADLARRRVTPAGELKHVADGRPVRVAGIVLVRQRPGTAKGITFVTLEDETGQANLIIRPDVWGKFRQAAIGATLLLVHGRLQRQSDVTHILVSRIEDYSDHWRELGSQSRDFC
jgi:error-prone DNA polymerase